MNPPFNQPTPSELLNGLPLVGQALTTVVNDLSRLEEFMDEVLYDFFELTEAIHRVLQGGTKPAGRPGKDEPPRVDRQARKHLAAAGVSSLEFTWQPDGSAIIQINGGPDVKLTPGPAFLLKLLLADNGEESPDHLMPWKSRSAVFEGLKPRIGKTDIEGAVRQLFYRLRLELSEQGQNPFLVMNSRKLGYRFALRRGKSSQDGGGLPGNTNGKQI